ncbi:MAG: nucleotidyltransferase domain-containing protein [Nitrospirae bacterium]|nr:nucleotidyltransferase domain-containing protein [Nitrospirota bacterium]
MNKENITKEIKRIKDKIVEQYRPQKIILFGSYAYGKPDYDSDVDFLIIMPFKGKGQYKAIEILEGISSSIPIDLLVRTPAQVKTRIAQNDFFMRRVLTKGKILYEAPH